MSCHNRDKVTWWLGPAAWVERVVLSIVLFAFFLAGHSVLNELASHRPRRYLPVLIKDHVPFVPFFVVIYLSSFAMVFVPALVVKGRPAFLRTAAAFLIVLLVGFAFFLAVPLTVDRVESPEGDGPFIQWLLWFQSQAKPHNTFPSLHVALCLIAALACLLHSRIAGIVMCIYAALVAVSTLLLRLHVALDVIAGIALALGVWMWVRRSPAKERSSGRDGEWASGRRTEDRSYAATDCTD